MRPSCPDDVTAQAHATLALAVIRGLMLDDNATGDHSRIDAAFAPSTACRPSARWSSPSVPVSVRDGPSLGRVVNGLHVIAVGVKDECPVVARRVFGTNAGGAIVTPSGGDRRRVELVDLLR